MKIFRNTFRIFVGAMFSYQCLVSFHKYSNTYPTSTTTQKKDLKDQVFWPEFLLCPEDGVDLTKLSDKGYESMSDFYMGRLRNGRRGWGGLNNESFAMIKNATRILIGDRLG